MLNFLKNEGFTKVKVTSEGNTLYNVEKNNIIINFTLNDATDMSKNFFRIYYADDNIALHGKTWEQVKLIIDVLYSNKESR